MSRYPGRILSSTAPTVSANSAKGIWTLDEAMRYIRAGQWPVPTGNGDPYFQYNTMLLPGQGTNGAQNNTFLDSSTNNFTITRNGNTTQGTFTPFSGADGNWSTFLNGSSSLSVNVSGISAGTSTFTLEFWVYLTAYPGADVPFVDTRSANGASTTAFQFGVYSTGKLKFYDGTETNLNGSVPLNQWTHIALVRDSGNTVTAYINGVSTGTTVSSTRNFSDNYFWIASVPAPASPYLNGYLSNLRWVVGSAVYTSAFTPPTSPLTAITNTKLLTLQSNRFVDNSANAYAITLNSTPQITPFQPFGAPTNAYSASTIGGSAYSDGSGDYLTVAANANLTLGSSDFTIELWWYPLAFNSDSEILTMASSGGTNRCFAIYSNASNGTLLAFAGTGSTSWDIVSSLSMGTAKQYAWNHIAFTRSGSTFSTYLNGARIATTTASGTLGSSGLGILANNSGTSQAPSSYISGVRTIKGTALYTGTTYTVPTEPPTAVTNTNFLANFTNAGIIDNAQDNNLETVGNAQISTTQYKWGASSVAFDGTTDYLIPNGSTTNVLAFGSGAFTIEMWFYVTSFPTQYGVLYDCRPASTNGSYPVISLENNGTAYFYVNTANAISSGSGVISTGRWYHLAVVKSGSSTKMFVNGNQVGSTYADTNTYLNPANRPVIGAEGFTLGNNSLNGYIQDLRITKGLGRYLYNFTAPTAALPLFWQAAATPSSDPYFDYTTLLLPGNGTNGAQNNTFLDSSTNNFTITRNGNTTQGTFTPFSQTGWSNNFNGSSWFTNGTTISLGTNDFCMEAWYFGTGGDTGLISQRTTGNANGWSLNAGKFVALVGGSWLDPVVGNASFGVANQWTHVAVTRSGTAFRLFVNGVLVSYATASGSVADQNIPTVGAASAGGEGPFNGYISNLRVCNGSIPTSYQTSATAVGTPVFTPPTTAVTTTSQGAANVTYLTCQSNRFVDNSSVARTLTFNGTPTVQAFNPYSPTASYSTSVVGGSGYFDGTGDYLTTPSSSQFAPAGDFTIGFWFYPTSLAAAFSAPLGNFTGNNSTDWLIEVTSAGVLNIYTNGSTVRIASSSGAIKANQWQYIAVCRSGSTITAYLNGTSVGTYSQSGTFGSASKAIGIGARPDTQSPITGYVSSVILLDGTVTTTVPSAPSTAVSGTSLLCNFTNGGIIDNTAKNNLETVGGASISTTQSKFGGSSMYFDGTGDYLYAVSGQNFNYGSGDFTVELWMRLNANPGGDAGIVDQRPASTNGNYFMLGINSSGQLFVYVNGASRIAASSATAIATANWYHIAYSKYGTTGVLYVNGISVGSWTDNYTYLVSPCTVGHHQFAGSDLNAYINDLRLTKGIARYTQNFTPPTTAFLTL